MSEPVYINFTYSSPHDDFDACVGLNSDGSTNINYTLMALKNKLSENILLIDRLLEQSNLIAGMYTAGYDLVAIYTNSQNDSQTLLDTGLVRETVTINSDDAYDEDEELTDQDEETHTDRLRMINNIVNVGNDKIDDDSDESSENSELMNDYESVGSILSKYQKIIEETREIYSDDSD